MNARLLSIAVRVIAKSGREHPADGVLRSELRKATGITRGEGGEISRAVFAYYRWLGWLNQKDSMERRVEEAVERNRSFQNNSWKISGPELERAVPGWVKQQMEVSEEWLRALQREPQIWLRARAGEGRGLAERLGECRAAGDGAMPDALRYEGRKDLFRTAEFHAGEFELQDVSSQIVGLICNPRSGETWWDACAGEGGKTLHLCDLMRNKGLVWASDRAMWRLQKLKRRAARAKAFNYRAVLWDGGRKLPTKTKFDGILVDAPCSGLGTWQRNPQARWTTTPRDVEELSETQRRLLESVAQALKPGGRMVYSVCTLTKAETLDVVEAVTKQFADLKLTGLKNPLEPECPSTELLQLWPQLVDGNGMFICCWEKQGGRVVR